MDKKEERTPLGDMAVVKVTRDSRGTEYAHLENGMIVRVVPKK